jgi:hypothetical protein
MSGARAGMGGWSASPFRRAWACGCEKIVRRPECPFDEDRDNCYNNSALIDLGRLEAIQRCLHQQLILRIVVGVMSGKVFINYRREDTAQAAGRIYDRLAQAFGREAIFMDIDKIPYGNDFTTHIRDQFNSCKIVVALIGPKWLSARRGWRFFSKRRIDESLDWVRT